MNYAHAVGRLPQGDWTRANGSIRLSDWSTFTLSASAYGLKGTNSLSPQAAALIGGNGLRRFQEFGEYPSGWDGMHSRPLNPLSIASCNLFASSITNAPVEPSIFMTRRGNLQLAWETNGGKHVELEFSPSKIEYLVGDEEGAFDFTEIGKLLGRLKAI